MGWLELWTPIVSYGLYALAAALIVLLFCCLAWG